MNKYYFGLLLICFIGNLVGQEKIDGSFAFDTDPNKLYSLYIPSSYDATVPNKMMLALHPFNTARWDGRAWRDTLTTFAEMNNLILVSPDGGIDGKVDSPIDTAFTTTLLDSVALWYNIAPEERYVMGFSWGGKTSYTYGLRNTEKFSGYLIIGAAVEINEVNGIIENANEETFFLVHGSNDSPNIRFTPLLNALEVNDACVSSNLMSGVNHTIDFPNRNAILTEAFNWILDNSCKSSSIDNNSFYTSFQMYPNPAKGELFISVADNGAFQISIYDATGNKVLQKQGLEKLDISDLPEGLYVVECKYLNSGIIQTKSLLVN